MRLMKLAVSLGLVGMLGGVSFAQTAPASTTIPNATTQTAAPAPAKAEDEAAARQARIAEALKEYHGPDYVRSEVMIPMRDGVTLHTVILRPVGSEKDGAALPFLMTRTPYGVDGYTGCCGEAGEAGAGGEWVHLCGAGYSRAV